MSDAVVLALGGNALVRPDEPQGFDQQVQNAATAADHIARAVDEGEQVVVTHGNGPQVGNVLLQNDTAAESAEQMPLFACSAESQGLIGAALALAINEALQRRCLDCMAVPVLTPVVVDTNSLGELTKPVGPFYTESEAKKRERENDVEFREDAGRGWRRVVPSPDPEHIDCVDTIEQILAAGNVPIAAGGGGLPVVNTEDNRVEYVNGVVDKDLAAAQLATQLGSSQLIILTDVPNVLLNYGTPYEKALETVDYETARSYQEAGHFKSGSMYEKVEAVCRFLESGIDRRATITSLDQCAQALAGTVGTQFVQSGESATEAGNAQESATDIDRK